MRRSRFSTRFKDGPRFSWHYLRYVREGAINGQVSNVAIAELLQAKCDPDITAAHVKRWRDQHPQFNLVCKHALNEANSVIANAAWKAAAEGDTTQQRFWLERRHPDFLPKSKHIIDGSPDTLDALLRRRMTDEEAKAQGIIREPKGDDWPPDVEDDGDD